MKTVLLGIGNLHRGDDGAGPVFARWFKHPGYVCFNCHTAPENFTGAVRREKPGRLLLVDAAEMGLAPGALRRIPLEHAGDAAIGTHALGLRQLAWFLQDCVPEIAIIGIQPACLQTRVGLSPAVRAALRELRALLSAAGTTVAGCDNSVPLPHWSPPAS